MVSKLLIGIGVFAALWIGFDYYQQQKALELYQQQVASFNKRFEERREAFAKDWSTQVASFNKRFEERREAFAKDWDNTASHIDRK